MNDVDEDALSQLPDSRTFPGIVKLFLQVPGLTVIPPIFFERMPQLEVLDLSNTNILSLPSSISSLSSLQEFFLKDCPTLIEVPSQIGMLTNLKLFDMNGTEIMYIPKEIGNLANLEHLRVSLCMYADDYIKTQSVNVAVIPRMMISKLKKLKELCISVTPEAEWWKNEVKAIQHELCYLTDLETLKWYIPTNKVLQHFLQLETKNCLPLYPYLSNFMIIIGQHAQLTSRLPRGLEKKFEEFKKCLKWINGEGNRNDISKIMRNAEALFLSRHWTIEELPACDTTKLKYCLLVECNEMKTLTEADKLSDDVEITDVENGEKGGFECLQYLSIHYMKELQSIWKGPIGKHSLSKLMILSFHTCPELTTIFTPSIAHNLSCLTELIVEDCPKVISLISDEPPNFNSGHLFASLERITLLDLPELDKLFGGQIILENLDTLLVFNCVKLQCLSIMELPNIKEIKGETRWWNSLVCDKSKWVGNFVSLKEKRDLAEQLFEATDSLHHFHDTVLRGYEEKPSHGADVRGKLIIDEITIETEKNIVLLSEDETSAQAPTSVDIFDNAHSDFVQRSAWSSYVSSPHVRGQNSWMLPFGKCFSIPTGRSPISDDFQTASSNFEVSEPMFQNVSSKCPSPSLRVFTLTELKAATKNFDQSRKIGEGGSWIVYGGIVKSTNHSFNDIHVVVKWNKSRSQRYYRLVMAELNAHGEINHPNIVKLIGYCQEHYKDKRDVLLVYEYMPKGSLDDHFFASHTPLSWAMRLKIAKDAATGLVYLHQGVGLHEIIFRDLNPSKILLDNNMNAKLSNFGFAREGPQDGRPHVATIQRGKSNKYVAPEYIKTGRLTSMIDVWSYGIVLKELITGPRSLDIMTSVNDRRLLRWTCCYAGARKSKLIVDPMLKGNYSERSMEKVEFIVSKCLVKNPKLRPTMSEVLEMVKEAIALENRESATSK